MGRGDDLDGAGEACIEDFEACGGAEEDLEGVVAEAPEVVGLFVDGPGVGDDVEGFAAGLEGAVDLGGDEPGGGEVFEDGEGEDAVEGAGGDGAGEIVGVGDEVDAQGGVDVTADEGAFGGELGGVEAAVGADDAGADFEDGAAPGLHAGGEFGDGCGAVGVGEGWRAVDGGDGDFDVRDSEAVAQFEGDGAERGAGEIAGEAGFLGLGDLGEGGRRTSGRSGEGEFLAVCAAADGEGFEGLVVPVGPAFEVDALDVAPGAIDAVVGHSGGQGCGGVGADHVGGAFGDHHDGGLDVGGGDEGEDGGVGDAEGVDAAGRGDGGRGGRCRRRPCGRRPQGW